MVEIFYWLMTEQQLVRIKEELDVVCRQLQTQKSDGKDKVITLETLVNIARFMKYDTKFLFNLDELVKR